MKTKLFIALFLISTITFAQLKKQDTTSNNITSKAHFIRFDDVKGESNNASTKAHYIKIDGIKGETKESTTKRTIKIDSIEKPTPETKNYNNTRRRIEVLKSNKQGDPDKN